MKIWLKIAILTFLLTNVAIEVILFYVKAQEKDEIASLYGEKLQSVATIVSALIDGDKYEKLNFNDARDIYSDYYYKDVKALLLKTKEKLKLKENIYTLSLADSNSAIFGVMTNDIPFAGDTLHIQSKTEKQALQDIYQNGRNIKTGIYDDQYGMWVSGIAPIFNSENRVVGAVQLDHESSLIYSKLNELNSSVFYFRLLLIPLIIIVSIFFSKIITRPISMLTNTLDNISKGDYREAKPIKAYGEVKKLVESADIMRRTILDQQEKIFETMSQLKIHNKELITAKEKAEEMTKLKDTFLANMSHELRTPLIGALGFAEILNGDIEDAEQKEMAENIVVSMKRLLNTLNSLLELSLIASNKIKLVQSEVSINSLIEKVARNFVGSIKSKGLELRVKIPDDNIIIRTDEKLLSQVLNNLIDNAVKFTKEGFINIELNRIRGKDNSTCQIKIQDTGIGIPGDCYEMVFSEFRQASEGLSRNFEGIGLGLPIAKKYTELLNGNISLKSKVKEGSEFTVMLGV